MTGTGAIEDANQQAEPRAKVVRGRWKDWFLALSMANMAFMGSWFVMLYDSDRGYFNKLPVTQSTVTALAINLLWFTLFAWCLIRTWRRTSCSAVRFVLHLLIFLVLLIPFDFCRARVFHVTDYELVTFLRRPIVAGPGILLLALILWKNRLAARWVAILVGTLSPMALFVVWRIVALTLGLQHPQQHSGPRELAALQAVHGNQPRVIWMLFDEADYRLLFEQRPDKVLLPEFDRFRHESTFAENAYPPGGDTLISIPALLSGRPLKSVAIASHSDLELTTAAGSRVLWSELPSVFDAAQAAGVNSAVVGWYHPYDRVCGRSLAYCSWYPFSLFEWARSYSVTDALLRQLCVFGGSLWVKHLHAGVCQGTLADAQGIVADTKYGLLFLHLPFPHGPGVYEPETDSFTILPMSKAKGYFNNALLADRNFGKLRRTLEAAGQWDKTWVIISADHSWRQSSAFDGRHDFRVPFAAKPPGASQGMTYEPRLNTIITRDLVLAVLQKKVTNQQDLVCFLDSHKEQH